MIPQANSTGTGRRIASRRTNGKGRKIAFGWYGGKFSHLDFILPNIPLDAQHFCDVFGGSAAVLINRQPAPVETYNDIDSEAGQLLQDAKRRLDGATTRNQPYSIFEGGARPAHVSTNPVSPS